MSGRRLVRLTLLLTLSMSVAANIGHTILAQSDVPVWLRMIGAVFWPVAVFLAVEIFFRVPLSGTFMHRVAQALVLAPSVVAAITSYEHMHFMLLAMGERPFIALIGPGAVDAFMIGCTLILLFTRETERPAEDVDVDAIVERWVDSPAPVSPAPYDIGITDVVARTLPVDERDFIGSTDVVVKPRTGTAEKLAALLADPELKATDSTMRRYATVARALRDNPRAAVPEKLQGKVRPELVAQIREWAQTGQAYV